MKVTHYLRMKIIDVISLLRFRSFDVSTPEGRSRERHRRIVLTALASAAARTVSVLTSLISVPLTVGYLGTERYGLWMTISSVIAMLGFADLGIGNGLVNAVAEASGKDDRDMARKYVSSAFLLLVGIAVILATVFILIYPWVSWSRVFNVSSIQAITEAGPAMAVFIGCFLINVPVGVVQRIQRGYQEGFANNIWQVVGSLLGLVGVLVAILLRAGLPWLVFAMAGSPVLTTILNGIVLFGFQRPWLCPQISGFTVGAARRILSTGLLFFALQVATAIGYQSDNIVLARILGADAVVHYAVPLKLFSFVPVVLGFVLMPLWPAYGESIARGDVIWVRKTLIGSLAISLLIDIPIVSFLVVFGRPLVHLWVGPDVTPSPLLLVGLGAWSLLAGLGGPLAMFLNGLEVMGFQTVCAMLMGLSNIVISVFLVRRIGVSGVIYGSIIAQILFILLPSAFYVPRLLSSVQSRNSSGDPGT